MTTKLLIIFLFAYFSLIFTESPDSESPEATDTTISPTPRGKSTPGVDIEPTKLKCYQCIGTEKDKCQGVDVDYDKFVGANPSSAFNWNNNSWYKTECPSDTHVCLWVNKDSLTVRMCGPDKIFEKYEQTTNSTIIAQDLCVENKQVEVCSCIKNGCNKSPICDIPGYANSCTRSFRKPKARNDVFDYVQLGEDIHKSL